MSQDDGAERSHEATPQKLQEARRKGELVKSQDLAAWAGYLGALLCLVLVAPGAGRRLVDLGGTLLDRADTLSMPLRTGGPGQGGAVLVEAMTVIGLLALPGAALVLGVLIAQGAIVVAPEKLGFKLSRISVLANAKNKFGPSGLFEFAKSAVKMMLFGGLMVWFMVRHADRFVIAATGDPRAIPGLMPQLLAEFVIVVVILSGVIAAVDYLWQRHTHLAKNRMTRQEVLDEMKQSDGDPHLKAKRRQKAEEIAMNQMLGDVPDATVIVVNPTHYAVALKWSPLDPSPPVCLAKGVDHVAARIREAATEAGVPIFSDPPTARALHAAVDVGSPIDREHFAAVAVAIRFARALSGEGRR
ncbi:EscU/YscU/HrcU family type III secretion system export apparatus switch protein [Jannaschia rubra]|uniref:Flagellar biosynthetic protein FlhB n=1 Tax=Jannaschia rubra TaxID=282197 RepID=A0A0M6XQ17_9RHOB|nr:flagellar type III secretion system protein FlhB [Jannaschia rubra]CTQ33240.1 Flagellar biosynthetic protein FlhB [Jannaschia rubra]SFF97630.1 flagellar biosynthetic protein FlhB [Jannaschia rubra]